MIGISEFSVNKIVLGVGALEKLGSVLKELGIGKVLIVTDAFMAERKLVDPVLRQVEKSGVCVRHVHGRGAEPDGEERGGLRKGADRGEVPGGDRVRRRQLHGRREGGRDPRHQSAAGQALPRPRERAGARDPRHRDTDNLGNGERDHQHRDPEGRPGGNEGWDRQPARHPARRDRRPRVDPVPPPAPDRNHRDGRLVPRRGRVYLAQGDAVHGYLPPGSDPAGRAKPANRGEPGRRYRRQVRHGPGGDVDRHRTRGYRAPRPSTRWRTPSKGISRWPTGMPAPPCCPPSRGTTPWRKWRSSGRSR